MVYTCAIVEDEPLAELMLRKYISRISFLELSWTCAYAEEALKMLSQQNVDLLFLDLQQVPLVTGSAFDYILKKEKNVIIVSAFPSSMLDANIRVICFLNKPVAFDHFVEAIETFLAGLESLAPDEA